MLTIAILYVVGHLMVATAVGVLFKALRREPNLAMRRSGIFELSHRSARIEAGEAEVTVSRRELADLDRQIEEARQKTTDHVPLDDAPGTKWTFGILGTVLTELESAVFVLLTSPSQLLGLPAEMWALLGTPVAVSWVFTLHVFMGTLITDKQRPARTVRRAKAGALVVGSGVVSAVALILSGRNLTEEHLIEVLTAAGLMMLAILLSICGAFCSLVTTTLFETQRYEYKLQRLERRRETYALHIESIERDLIHLQTATPIDSKPGPKGPAAGRVAAAVGLLLLTGLPHLEAAQSPRDASTVAAITEARQASVVPMARDGACEIIVDLTGSVQRETLLATVAAVGDHLAAIVDGLGCRWIRLVPFAGDLFVTIEEIAIPTADAATAACKAVKPETVGARARAVELLYPRVAAKRQQQAEDDCIAAQHAAKARVISERTAVLTRVSTRLRALVTLRPQGPCTALYQVIARSVARAQHQVVISDGEQTCARSEPAAISIPPDTRMLFLLVPTARNRRQDRGNVLLTRVAVLERTFLTASVLFAPEATTAFWARFAQGK